MMKIKSASKVRSGKRQTAPVTSDPPGRLHALAAANLKLAGEVIRRQAAELALRKSERHQRRLRQQAEQMQAQMRDLSRRLLDAQEEERRRISRELHDDVLQTLVGINVQLETLGREAQRDLPHLEPKIAQAQRLVADSVSAIYRCARELRPLILDDLGLLPALRSCIADFQKRTVVGVRFTSCPDAEQLTSARRTAVYRVVQSALANVAQHAAARRVKVSIENVGERVRLLIHDDGKSFDVERTLHARRYKRLGLLGMRERIEMVGGSFAVESSPGRGTTVRVEIPRGGRSRKKRPAPKAAASP